MITGFKIKQVLENEEGQTGGKKHSNLEQLEAGLAQSRSAIKEARHKNETFDDPDYVPRGPMYLNPSAFQRYQQELNSF